MSLHTMSPAIRTALVEACANYECSGSGGGRNLYDVVKELLEEDARAHVACAQLSSTRVTVDPQILIDARIELAAFYDLVAPYRGDRMPVKMYGIPEGFARVGAMLRRLDAVIADLPKGG